MAENKTNEQLADEIIASNYRWSNDINADNYEEICKYIQERKDPNISLKMHNLVTNMLEANYSWKDIVDKYPGILFIEFDRIIQNLEESEKIEKSLCDLGQLSINGINIGKLFIKCNLNHIYCYAISPKAKKIYRCTLNAIAQHISESNYIAIFKKCTPDILKDDMIEIPTFKKFRDIYILTHTKDYFDSAPFYCQKRYFYYNLPENDEKIAVVVDSIVTENKQKFESVISIKMRKIINTLKEIDGTQDRIKENKEIDDLCLELHSIFRNIGQIDEKNRDEFVEIARIVSLFIEQKKLYTKTFKTAMDKLIQLIDEKNQ